MLSEVPFPQFVTLLLWGWGSIGTTQALEADRPGLATWLMPTGHPFPMNRLSGGSVSSDYG